MQNIQDEVASQEESNSQSTHSRKKRGRKQFEVISSDLLGFIPPSSEDEEDLFRPRPRPPRVQSSKRQAQRKFNFRNRLRFVVDGDEVLPADIRKFKGQSFDQWNQIKQVIFTVTINHPVVCPICLNGTQQIVGPQITACGHVFCGPCILKHLKVSKKQYNCPVCNQFVSKPELKPCLFAGVTHAGDNKIVLVLRVREPGGDVVFDSQTLQQDVNFSRFIRSTKEYLVEQLANQRNGLEEYLGQYLSEGEEVDIPHITEAIDLASEKMLTLKERLKNQKSITSKVRDVKQGIYFQRLDQSKKKDVTYFYQEQHGRLHFLHPICNRYLCEQFMSNDHLPLSMTSQINYQQSLVMDQRAMRRYKYINHLAEESQITFVQIAMSNFLQSSVYEQYMKEMTRHKNKLKAREEQDDKRNEDLINKRLARKKIKQYSAPDIWPAQSEIRDLKTCNREENFPSLPGWSPKLMHQNTQPLAVTKPVQPLLSNSISNMSAKETDFPEIGEQVSKTQKRTKGKRGKKRDQKDITEMMFQSHEDDD